MDWLAPTKRKLAKRDTAIQRWAQQQQDRVLTKPRGSHPTSGPDHMEVKVAWLCLTLCNPMDYRVHRILQVRVLEWAAVPFSKGSSQPKDRTQVSRIAGRFFTNWVTREHELMKFPNLLSYLALGYLQVQYRNSKYICFLHVVHQLYNMPYLLWESKPTKTHTHTHTHTHTTVSSQS